MSVYACLRIRVRGFSDVVTNLSLMRLEPQICPQNQQTLDGDMSLSNES